MSGDLVAWLRPKIEADLEHWRDHAAAYLVNVEREGDYLYCEARERVAQLEAALAVLGEHRPFDPESDWLGDYCATCGEIDHRKVSFPCRTVRLLARGYRYHPGYPLGFPVRPLSGEPCGRNCEESPENPELAGLCERIGLTPMDIREREA